MEYVASTIYTFYETCNREYVGTNGNDTLEARGKIFDFDIVASITFFTQSSQCIKSFL